MAHPMLSEFSETIWFDQWRAQDAERMYQEKLAGTSGAAQAQTGSSSLVKEIAKARQHIQKSLNDGVAAVSGGLDNALAARLETVEKENQALRKVTEDLRQMIKNLENRVNTLEGGKAPAAAPAKSPAPAKPAPADDDDDEDDDFELFGDDDSEDDEAAAKLKEERLAAYAAKKSKKPALVAKSNIILDVKPWDDETDMKEMERLVRTIEMDGLLWGAAKLVPVGYGIKKLQICCVVEDDKVGTDDLEERITEFEDFVQSVDIAAFNKI